MGAAMLPPALDLRTAPPLQGCGDGPAHARHEWAVSAIAARLAAFDPVVVSSLAAGLGTDGSDLDVVCDLRAPGFLDAVRGAYEHRPAFTIRPDGPLTLVTFTGARLTVELVGAARPVEEQTAYRHAVAHRRLVAAGGPAFACAVREQRRLDGLKTEPALAAVLGLDGEPYAAIERLAAVGDAELIELVRARPRR
jgi:hypothetical protein